MIPVDQIGPTGCFSAAVASLLEVNAELVPNFMRSNWKGERDVVDDAWWPSFLAWLRPLGFWAISFPVRQQMPELPEAGWFIVNGETASGGSHSIVAHGDGTTFDPHPKRAGLATRELAVMLVPLDPARPLRSIRLAIMQKDPATYRMLLEREQARREEQAELLVKLLESTGMRPAACTISIRDEP